MCTPLFVFAQVVLSKALLLLLRVQTSGGATTNDEVVNVALSFIVGTTPPSTFGVSLTSSTTQMTNTCVTTSACCVCSFLRITFSMSSIAATVCLHECVACGLLCFNQSKASQHRLVSATKRHGRHGVPCDSVCWLICFSWATELRRHVEANTSGIRST